ncbi:AAA domain-containing protein [Bremerella sp. T1]|uniref:AAA domain-containing protein n=1 Tax=Bremerella sp. TYQ1 TaxID=3119568 RepID=UPI001CCDE5E8|nr:AAA domain-containing protein [Bremerella volcania]UBM37447.1 AAA family ATPase [Bremerella volcania]
MARLHLRGLPPGTNRNQLFKLLIEQADLPGKEIGAIDLIRRQATVEVAEDRAKRAVKTLRETMPEVDVFFEPDQIEWPPLFEKFRHWMQLEAKEEATRLAEGRQKEGMLKGLKLHEQWSALAGRVICQFRPKTQGASLPPHRFRSGSPVVLQDIEQNQVRGLVASVRDGSIEVVTQDFLENDDDPFQLIPSDDEVTRRRMEYALKRAASANDNRLAELRDVLLGEAKPTFDSTSDVPTPPRTLNDSQWGAVENALRANDVAIIHGPPGTGKTVTLAHLIKSLVDRGEKVLACAPSNLAVDNLMLRAMAQGVKAVRLGHPARVSETLHDATLDYLARSHPDAKLAEKLIKEGQAKLRSAGRYTRAKPAPGEKAAIRDEARGLFDDAQRMQRQTLDQILSEASLLCATLTGVDDDLLAGRMFDTVVIDEACQAVEPACWIPLARAKRVILAGDHCQLPPTILSQVAASEGYAESLQERIVRQHPNVAKLLDRQYRMHDLIMTFSSEEFYEGKLSADESVVAHDLQPLLNEAVYVDPKPWQYYDTAGADFVEEEDDATSSRFNDAEARFVAKKVQQFIDAGVAPQAISVISPYAAQVQRLRNLLPQNVEADTIDGFQGRENEVVLISLVRSNNSGEIGFLLDTRRMNVALTRARRKLILIGDSSTIGGNSFYERLLQYAETADGYHSVWEEMD